MIARLGLPLVFAVPSLVLEMERKTDWLSELGAALEIACAF